MTRSNKVDVESGNNNQLYPMMLESPQLRWAFIRKVYSILCIQMLLTTAVAATVVFVRPIPNFFTQTAAGLAVYIVICILPIILLWPLYYYHKRHPWNFFILMLFTVSISFVVGLACAFTKEPSWLFLGEKKQCECEGKELWRLELWLILNSIGIGDESKFSVPLFLLHYIFHK
ncbi:protein lifeguard 4 [Quercus suber]|uniref:Protein lifeguard 4 n=1 Tax=Quercus suber TaxID=58331 RepID=A0AAW0IVH1_QUESU